MCLILFRSEGFHMNRPTMDKLGAHIYYSLWLDKASSLPPYNSVTGMSHDLASGTI